MFDLCRERATEGGHVGKLGINSPALSLLGYLDGRVANVDILLGLCGIGQYLIASAFNIDCII